MPRPDLTINQIAHEWRGARPPGGSVSRYGADLNKLTVDPAVGLSVNLSAAGNKLRMSDLGGS